MTSLSRPRHWLSRCSFENQRTGVVGQPLERAFSERRIEATAAGLPRQLLARSYPQAELVMVQNLLESTPRRKMVSIDALGAPRMEQLFLLDELGLKNVRALQPFDERDAPAKGCAAPRRPPRWNYLVSDDQGKLI